MGRNYAIPRWSKNLGYMLAYAVRAHDGPAPAEFFLGCSKCDTRLTLTIERLAELIQAKGPLYSLWNVVGVQGIHPALDGLARHRSSAPQEHGPNSLSCLAQVSEWSSQGASGPGDRSELTRAVSLASSRCNKKANRRAKTSEGCSAPMLLALAHCSASKARRSSSMVRGSSISGARLGKARRP